MRVVAIRRGEFGGVIYEAGDEFDVPSEVMEVKDGGQWFKPVERLADAVE